MHNIILYGCKLTAMMPVSFNQPMVKLIGQRRKPVAKTSITPLNHIINYINYSRNMEGSTSPERENINEFIDAVTPSFEELVKEVIDNDMYMQQNRDPKIFIYPLEDAFLNLDVIKIEMENLKFQWVPSYRIDNFSFNLKQQCVLINFSFGDIKVEGKYILNSLIIHKLLPISYNGNIGITFENVKAQGIIGLEALHDSLCPMIYDINYESTGILVKTNNYIDSENENKNEKLNATLDLPHCQDVWTQLKERLTNLLNDQLGEVIVDFSLSELLQNWTDEFRAMGEEQFTRANRFIDNILCKVKKYLVEVNWNEVITPPFDIVYKEPLGEYQGTLKTGPGYIKDLSTLTRHENFHIFQEKNIITLYGYLKLADFKHGYPKYESGYKENKVMGDINVNIDENKIFLRIKIDNESKDTKLDLIQLRTTKYINVIASNLDSENWLKPKLESWVKGNLRFKGFPLLEKHLKDAFQHVLINNTESF